MMQVSYKVYTTDTMISLFLPAIIQFGFDLRQREHGNHQKSTRLWKHPTQLNVQISGEVLRFDIYVIFRSKRVMISFEDNEDDIVSDMLSNAKKCQESKLSSQS